MTKKISILTALLVGFVALSSFSLSYSSLRALALENGISGPLSYLWPILIDFSIIVFSLSVVTAYLQSEKTWKQWALVGLYSICTVGFNVAHAPPGLQSQIVAAIAPVSLFFSFEILMSQLKTGIKRTSILQSIAKLTADFASKEATFDRQLERMRDSLRQRFANERTKLDKTLSDLESKLQNVSADLDKLTGQIARKEQKLAELNADIKQQNALNVSELQAKRQAKKADRAAKAQQLFAEGLTETQIADNLGIKDMRTIRGYLQQAQSGNGAK